MSGGEHQGIVINKEVEAGGEEEPSHLRLEFRVFLVNVNSGKHAQERRLLSFWFKASMSVQERPRYAQDFFKQLVSPFQFPRGESFLDAIASLLLPRIVTDRLQKIHQL